MEKREKGHPHGNRKGILSRGLRKPFKRYKQRKTTYLLFARQEGTRRERQGRQTKKIDAERTKTFMFFSLFAYDKACNAVSRADIAVWCTLRHEGTDRFTFRTLTLLFRFFGAFISRGPARFRISPQKNRIVSTTIQVRHIATMIQVRHIATMVWVRRLRTIDRGSLFC